MFATRTLAGVLLAGAVATGGTVAVDLVRADRVATLNDPITMGQAIKFHAPSHTVEINDNGLIEFVVGGEKRYGLTPSEAHGKNKTLFLDVETKQNEATYKDVFGAGSELIVKNTPLSFSKVVSFTEGFLKTIPEGAEYVEVSFDLTGFNVPDGIYTDRIQIQKDVWLEKSLAWDSSLGDTENDIPNSNYTDIAIEIKDGVLTKRIPTEWLQSATYPIYTDAVFTFGTKELFDTGVIGTIDAVTIGTDKSVFCWNDNADTSQEGQCAVATVSGTDLTFGSVSDFAADAFGSFNQATSACAAGTDRWVVVFEEDTSFDGVARVASSTGTTINGYGVATAFEANAGPFPVCTYISTDKIAIVWTDNNDRNIEAISCTINTDYTLSCGSPVIVVNTPATTFVDISCATATTDKFVCMYENTTNTDTFIFASTVSGTTVTAGTPVISSHINQDTLGHTIISPVTDKFAYIYTGNVGASPITMGLGSISGTTITLGATSTLMATTTSFASLIAIDSDSAFFMGQWGVFDQPTTFLAAVPIELNFGTLTFSTSTAEQVDATTDPGSLHAAKIGDCKFALVWEDDNDTNDLFAKIGDLVGCPASNHDDIIWWQ